MPNSMAREGREAQAPPELRFFSSVERALLPAALALALAFASVCSGPLPLLLPLLQCGAGTPARCPCPCSCLLPKARLYPLSGLRTIFRSIDIEKIPLRKPSNRQLSLIHHSKLHLRKCRVNFILPRPQRLFRHRRKATSIHRTQRL